MPRLPQPDQFANYPLRLAIRQVFARPLLTGSLLLALAPAGQAMTLGDISVHSVLGQRLDATVPVSLGAGEALTSTCVVPGNRSVDLRSIPGAMVMTPEATREGVYDLQITSASALYEPMYQLDLKVQCPGAPVVIRQYVLMLDLPGAVATNMPRTSDPVIITPPEEADEQDADAATRSAPLPPRPVRTLANAGRPGETIDVGARYRVVTGDSLSSIAARVRSRTMSLWTLADAIHAANPQAFIRGDANLIKLGSEIVIPTSAPTAAAPEPIPSPVVVPAPASVPVPEPAPVISPVVATQPPVAAALPPAIPAATRTAAPKRPPAPHAQAASPANEPNPVIAAGAGILFGLCVSAMLWFRGRLPSRQRSVAKPAPAHQPPLNLPKAERATGPAPVPLVTRPVEPAFSVHYSPAPEDTLETEFAGDDVTAELDDLFDSPDTTISKRLGAEKTVAARTLGIESPEPPAPVVVKAGSAVDFLVGDPVNEENTGQAQTVDIHALAASATGDEQQAQTLLEALTLLERDYEEELTASQVLDMSAMRAALNDDLDGPTQVSAAQIGSASARKKSR